MPVCACVRARARVRVRVLRRVSVCASVYISSHCMVPSIKNSISDFEHIEQGSRCRQGTPKAHLEPSRHHNSKTIAHTHPSSSLSLHELHASRVLAAVLRAALLNDVDAKVAIRAVHRLV